MLTLRKSARGFTLIELMVGLTIVAVILAIGVPSFGVWIQNSRIRNAADAIVNGINLARAEAVRRNTAVLFALKTNSTWEVSVGGNTIQKRDAVDGSDSVDVAPNAGASEVTFNGMGAVVTNTDGSASLSSIDITSTVAKQSQGARPLRVVVTLAGSVRMCDPYVATDDPRSCG